MAKHRYVDLSWSKMRERLTVILKEEGLVDDYLIKKEGTKGTIRVYLKYTGRNPVIQGLKRMSKPGLRRYVTAENIPNFFGGLGVPIVSTSQGILAGKEARKRNIGGELLCLVW
jgi:small subunit ribosomal protein S8